MYVDILFYKKDIHLINLTEFQEGLLFYTVIYVCIHHIYSSMYMYCREYAELCFKLYLMMNIYVPICIHTYWMIMDG